MINTGWTKTEIEWPDRVATYRWRNITVAMWPQEVEVWMDEVGWIHCPSLGARIEISNRIVELMAWMKRMGSPGRSDALVGFVCGICCGRTHMGLSLPGDEKHIYCLNCHGHYYCGRWWANGEWHEFVIEANPFGEWKMRKIAALMGCIKSEISMTEGGAL